MGREAVALATVMIPTLQRSAAVIRGRVRMHGTGRFGLRSDAGRLRQIHAHRHHQQVQRQQHAEYGALQAGLPDGRAEHQSVVVEGAVEATAEEVAGSAAVGAATAGALAATGTLAAIGALAATAGSGPDFVAAGA